MRRTPIPGRRARSTALLSIALLWGCATGMDRAGSGIAPASVEPEAIASVAFTEGPTVGPDGSVYFSEMLTGRILKFIPEGGVETEPEGPGNARRELRRALGGRVEIFRAESNGANGLIFDEEGRLIAAEGLGRRITRTDLSTGAIDVLVRHGPESPIDMANDLTLDGKGRIFFTDYVGKRVYRIDPDGLVEQILGEDEVEAPNGIVVSPDDDTLYLVEANSGKGGARSIRAYDLAPNGTVDHMRVFHDFAPGRSADGLAIDREGNVYAAAGLNRPRGTAETLDTKAGIHVFAPDGSQIAFHPIWEDVVTNCAFGGADMKSLYVTAGKTLFMIRTKVAGTGR